jgi:hypothetical protein
MNEEFTSETAEVITQVENKHESRNRIALSWITRKRRREDASRMRSANTSAVSGQYKSLGMSVIDFQFTHRLVSIWPFPWSVYR